MSTTISPGGVTADDRNTYIITGGARGIGRGLARYLLKHGNRVFIIDNNHEEGANTRNLLKNGGHIPDKDYHVSLADIGDPEVVKIAVAEASKLFGPRLDCLINNAAYTGGVGGLSLENMTVEEWNKSLRTNLTGPMLMTRACLPMLAESQGCVINISSTRAKQSEPNNEAYSTTKAGILGLTQSLAVSLAPKKVRVNAIVPGWIHVEDQCKAADDNERSWSDGLSTADNEWHLTGEVGHVEDIVKAVEYLTIAHGVTGAELVVDGGVSRKMVYPE